MWRCVLRRVWHDWWEGDAGQCLFFCVVLAISVLILIGLWHGICALTIWAFGLGIATLIGRYAALSILLSLCVALLCMVAWGIVLGIRRICEIVRECKG
jgi:hypothetical protein